MVRFRHFDHVFTDSVIYALLYVKHKNEQEKPGISLIKDGKSLEKRYFKYYRNCIIFQIDDELPEGVVIRHKSDFNSVAYTGSVLANSKINVADLVPQEDNLLKREKA